MPETNLNFEISTSQLKISRYDVFHNVSQGYFFGWGIVGVFWMSQNLFRGISLIAFADTLFDIPDKYGHTSHLAIIKLAKKSYKILWD